MEKETVGAAAERYSGRGFIVSLGGCHDRELPNNAPHLNVNGTEGRGETGVYSLTRLWQLPGTAAALTRRSFQLRDSCQCLACGHSGRTCGRLFGFFLS